MLYGFVEGIGLKPALDITFKIAGKTPITDADIQDNIQNNPGFEENYSIGQTLAIIPAISGAMSGGAPQSSPVYATSTGTAGAGPVAIEVNTPIYFADNSSGENNEKRPVNGKGEPYPKVKVEGYGEVPFPEGPYTPNNSKTLRAPFNDTFKKQFKDWWTGQGRPWPDGEVNIHHIKPLSRGGENVFENLVPLVQPKQHQPFTNWWRSYP